jgi:hypothetical protein
VEKAKPSAQRRARTARQPCPRPTVGAEIILKESFGGDATGDAEYMVPCLVIAANRAGHLYLSNYFRWLAERASSVGAGADGDHEHLARLEAPFNANLSDDIDFRLVTITRKNRAALLEHYAISEGTQKRGNLAARYHRIIETSESIRKGERSANVDYTPISTLVARVPLKPKSRSMPRAGR